MVIGEGKPINVKAKKLAIIFTDTEEIANVEIEPGWSTSKIFTVENKSGSTNSLHTFNFISSICFKIINNFVNRINIIFASKFINYKRNKMFSTYSFRRVTFNRFFSSFIPSSISREV